MSCSLTRRPMRSVHCMISIHSKTDISILDTSTCLLCKTDAPFAYAGPLHFGGNVMRTFAIVVLACIVPLPQSANAQDWPVRPVTMVVPFVAGGSQDVLGRV